MPQMQQTNRLEIRAIRPLGGHPQRTSPPVDPDTMTLVQGVRRDLGGGVFQHLTSPLRRRTVRRHPMRWKHVHPELPELCPRRNPDGQLARGQHRRRPDPAVLVAGHGNGGLAVDWPALHVDPRSGWPGQFHRRRRQAPSWRPDRGKHLVGQRIFRRAGYHHTYR
jgi:hypothetical protein